MKIGYVRVSTKEQETKMQWDALQQVGCERIFEDRASGVKEDRPGLVEMFGHFRKGDILVVWRLDRLGRSLRQLIDFANDLDTMGVALCSLHEKIDTSTPGGKLVFHVFGALAEFERDLIRERTRAGLESARKRGIKGGRKRKLDEEQIEYGYHLYKKKELTVAEICTKLGGVSRRTFYLAIDGKRREDLLILHHKGKSISELQKKTGYSYENIRNILEEYSKGKK